MPISKPTDIDEATGLSYGYIRAELAKSQEDVAAGRVTNITTDAQANRFVSGVITRGRSMIQEGLDDIATGRVYPGNTPAERQRFMALVDADAQDLLADIERERIR